MPSHLEQMQPAIGTRRSPPRDLPVSGTCGFQSPEHMARGYKRLGLTFLSMPSVQLSLGLQRTCCALLLTDHLGSL